MPGALKMREADGQTAPESSQFPAAKRKDKKKNHRKRRKLRSPILETVENGRNLEEPLDQVVRDAIGGNELQGEASLKVAEIVQVNLKKRKRIEGEHREENNDMVSASLAHDRVWHYVCNRSVMVDSKGIRGSGAETESSNVIPNRRYGYNTVVTELLVAGKTIVVTNTKECAVVHDWLMRQQGTEFGLDTEWRPSFTKGTEYKVALLQICGESECLIVAMMYLDKIPESLVNFLDDPTILLSGVGVKVDAVKLKKDWGLQCQGVVDLTTLAANTLDRPELKSVGLKALAKLVLDFDMQKPKRVTMSNWAKRVLDKVQVEYASLDAWVSYEIHQQLGRIDTYGV